MQAHSAPAESPFTQRWPLVSIEAIRRSVSDVIHHADADADCIAQLFEIYRFIFLIRHIRKIDSCEITNGIRCERLFATGIRAYNLLPISLRVRHIVRIIDKEYARLR